MGVWLGWEDCRGCRRLRNRVLGSGSVSCFGCRDGSWVVRVVCTGRKGWIGWVGAFVGVALVSFFWVSVCGYRITGCVVGVALASSSLMC